MALWADTVSEIGGGTSPSLSEALAVSSTGISCFLSAGVRACFSCPSMISWASSLALWADTVSGIGGGGRSSYSVWEVLGLLSNNLIFLREVADILGGLNLFNSSAISACTCLDISRLSTPIYPVRTPIWVHPSST